MKKPILIGSIVVAVVVIGMLIQSASAADYKGTVVAVEDNNLTLQTASGEEVTVQVTSSTKLNNDLKLEDFATGDEVSVQIQGKKDASTVEAKSVKNKTISSDNQRSYEGIIQQIDATGFTLSVSFSGGLEKILFLPRIEVNENTKISMKGVSVLLIDLRSGMRAEVSGKWDGSRGAGVLVAQKVSVQASEAISETKQPSTTKPGETKQPTTTPTPQETKQPSVTIKTVTVVGTIGCMPKRVAPGTPTTEECLLGLITAEGQNFALLDFKFGSVSSGTQVKVSGTLTTRVPVGPDGNSYDVQGTIMVTSLVVVP